MLDNRGRGLSDQRPGLGHSTEDYAEDAAGVIEALGLAPTMVLGHSMGARVAAARSHAPLRPGRSAGERAWPKALSKSAAEVSRRHRRGLAWRGLCRQSEVQ